MRLSSPAHFFNDLHFVLSALRYPLPKCPQAALWIGKGISFRPLALIHFSTDVEPAYKVHTQIIGQTLAHLGIFIEMLTEVE